MRQNYEVIKIKMTQLGRVHYLKIYQTLATLISIDIFPIDFVFLDQSIHYNVNLQEG